MPKGNDYGGIGHTKISNQINIDDSELSREMGEYWETYFKQLIGAVLDNELKGLKSLDYWNNRYTYDLEDYLEANKNLVELISIFLIKSDSYYVNKLEIKII